MASKAKKEELFADEILKWHKDKKISYPWRETSDPYAVLTAEILLRKTTRLQVSRIFRDFLQKYPSFRELASADRMKLEALISPLGMQVKRSELLIGVSREIVEKYGGSLPLSKRQLEDIRGIGPYTANAVLAVLENAEMPMADTNVLRLITRVFGLESKRARARDDSEIWAFTAGIIPAGRSKDFNFAMLDFADSVCRSRNPRCSECPINGICSYWGKTSSRR